MVVPIAAVWTTLTGEGVLASTATVDTGHHPGRGGKNAVAELRVHFPEDDPGKDVAHRWRKDLCDKVEKEVDGKRCDRSGWSTMDHPYRRGGPRKPHRLRALIRRLPWQPSGHLQPQSSQRSYRLSLDVS
jgi:hypothetical protein